MYFGGIKMNLLKSIPSTFKKPAWIALFALGFLHLALTALVSFGNFGGTFIAVLANILITFTVLAALVAVPLLVVLGKRDAALIVFTVLTGYWLISTSMNQLGNANMFDVDNPVMFNVAVIFSFIYGVILLGTFVMIVLSIVFKKNPLYNSLSFLGLLSCILFGLICGIFWIVQYAQMNAQWTSFVDCINMFVVLPVLVSTGCVYFYLTKK